ncbi:hypothetical protein [Nocardia sp. NPDC046763]|uniref:hypothetical protein n=1 Tax=Nocardia sp. NPDC046763 TaxID=3155256 RepID=UPI0033D9B0F4
MSTTESESRTTESEPPTPPDEGEHAYTGSWSDWITGAAGPVLAGYGEYSEQSGSRRESAARREGYAAGHDEYEADEFDDEYDDFDDEYYEPRSADSNPQQATRRAETASEHSGPGTRPTSGSAHARSIEEPSDTLQASASHARLGRARAGDPPRALTAYDLARHASGTDGPPPGYPTARRPLKRAARPTRSRPRFALPTLNGGQWAVPLLGLLAVLAVTAAIAVQISKVTGGDAPAKPHVATPRAAPAASIPAAASPTDQPASGVPANLCPNEVNGGNVRGNGPGSTKSGPDAILALQNRYYVDRSGKAVRAMFAPDAPTPTVDQIQAGIDTIPVGTTYCVQIMPGPFDGQHIMVVTEQHPDATKRTWSPQLVITTKIGDATLISAIVPMNEDTPK